MCANTVRVNAKDVSGYVDDREHGGGATIRSALEHKNLTNVTVCIAWVCRGVYLGVKKD